MNRNLIAAKVRAGIATAHELGTLRQSDLIAIKSDDERPHYRWGHDVLIQRAGEAALPDGQVEHVFSSDRRDAMGDRILVPGWDLSRTRGKALGVFWGHEAREFPIGRVLRAWKGKLPEGMKAAEDETRDAKPSRLSRKALMGRSEFHPAEAYGDTNFGEKAVAAHALVSRGLVKGGSVGFVPIKIHWPESAEERAELDLGESGVLFEEQELLEWSITPIPANPDATQTRSAVRSFKTRTTAALLPLTRRGLISADTADELLEWLVGAGWEKALTEGEDRTVVAIRDAVERVPSEVLLEAGPPAAPDDEGDPEAGDEGLEGDEDWEDDPNDPNPAGEDEGAGEGEERLVLPELLISSGGESEIRLVVTEPPDDGGDFLERSWVYDPESGGWNEDVAVECDVVGVPLPERYVRLIEAQGRALRHTEGDRAPEEREALEALQDGTAVLLELCGRIFELLEDGAPRTTGGEGADGDGDEGLPETPDPSRATDPETYYELALRATQQLRGRARARASRRRTRQPTQR